MTSVVKMNALNRLDLLLSDVIMCEATTSTNRISETSETEPVSRLTLSERSSHPSQGLPPSVVKTIPLPPRRSSSALKNHRRHQHIQMSTDQKQYQPLLNSSTLDDLFRALTLECEQIIAATTSSQAKMQEKEIMPTPLKLQAALESNDDDYENLQPAKPLTPPKVTVSPLKTSIQVISPVKRHVVSITITSKVSTPPAISPTKVSCSATTSAMPPLPPPAAAAAVCRSSEDDSNDVSSSSTCRKRRRRARKQLISFNRARSSSSSNERKQIVQEKKPVTSKRSCSTDPRHQRPVDVYDNDLISCPSSQKQRTKRPQRRDISLQHALPITERFHTKNQSSPLSVLLTSSKVTSDFLDNPNQRQSRRSRLETVNQKPTMTLLDRMHQQLYRPPLTRPTNTKNIIPTHRIPSYPVY